MLSRLNPAERRFMVIAGLVVFGFANYFLVWPHFSDWNNLTRRLEAARTRAANYESVISQSARLRVELAQLKEKGGDVPIEDQALQFLRTIQGQANKSEVGVGNYGAQRTSTNSPFFLELSQTITIQSGEKQLVDFLYSLGAQDSMVRVRSLSLHPDGPRQQLSGNLTLMASYQKNAARIAPAAAAKPATPAATTTPAASPAARPTVPPPPLAPRAAPPKALTTDKK